MPVREVAFELDCFEWADERLEVAGRWKGLAGRRLNRPVLTVETEGGRRKHLAALPGGHFGAAEESWRAAFGWPGDPGEITGAELEVGGSVVVDLPLPDRKRRRRRKLAADTGDEALRTEVAALRGQVERLRSELAGRERENMQLRQRVDDDEPLVSEPGEPTVEIQRLAGEHQELTAELERLAAERDHTRGELSDEVERLHEDRDRMRVEIEQLQDDRERARADLDDMREAFSDAAEEAEEVRDRHRAEIAAMEDELRAERATVARLTAELAAGPELPPPATPSARRAAAPVVAVEPPAADEPSDWRAAADADSFGSADSVAPADDSTDSAEGVGSVGPARPRTTHQVPLTTWVRRDRRAADDSSGSADDVGSVGTVAPADDSTDSAEGVGSVGTGAPADESTDSADVVGSAEAGVPADESTDPDQVARRAAAAAPLTQPLAPVDATEEAPQPAIDDAASLPSVIDAPGPLRAGARPSVPPGAEEARPSRVPAWLRAGRGAGEDEGEDAERSSGPVFQAIKDRLDGLFASNGRAVADADDETAEEYEEPVPAPRRSAAAARARAEATVAARRNPAELWALRVLAAAARRGAADRLPADPHQHCVTARGGPGGSPPPASRSPPLSLLLPWALAFDPWAWLVWGREVGRLELDTAGGPSWKPLPVVATTVLALADGAAPALWLVLARAGGLLALAGAAALAGRLAGPVAAVAAAAAMALSDWWLFNTALGNSEGLLAAAVLWAVVAHLAGRHRAALALLLARRAAAPRGVAVPRRLRALALAQRPRARRRRSRLALLPVPLLWFGPDVLGAGGALGASDAARGTASPQSAVNADFPALEVLLDFAELLTLPVLLAAAAGAALGGTIARLARGRRRSPGSRSSR